MKWLGDNMLSFVPPTCRWDDSPLHTNNHGFTGITFAKVKSNPKRCGGYVSKHGPEEKTD